MGFDTFKMLWIPYHCLTQNTFTVLKIFCASHIHLPFTLERLATMIDSLPKILPFSECLIIGIKQLYSLLRLAGLPSLNNMPLRFLFVLSWLDSSFFFFFFNCWIVVNYMGISQLIYPFTHWKPYWLLLVWENINKPL